MKKLLQAALLMVGVTSVLLLSPAPVDAINVFDNCSGGTVCNEAKGGSNFNNLIQNLITALLFVLGTISVIMIIVGGIRYALSGGDSSSISSAKNTILYAVVGLIVALLSYAIVNFVVGSFK